MELPEALTERRFTCDACGTAVGILAVRCDECRDRLFWWDRVAHAVLDAPDVDRVSLPKYRVNHPIWEGYDRGLGWPKLGLTANYRKAAPDGRGIHVREFEREYEMHIDRAHPRDQTLKHLVVDAPRILEGLGRTGPTVPRLRDRGEDADGGDGGRFAAPDRDDWRRYGASLRSAAGRIRRVYGAEE